MARSLSNDLNNPHLFDQNLPGDYTYTDGALGKTACGQLTLATAPRDSAAQRAAGGENRRDGSDPYGIDDGGHLIGSRFGGAGTAENLTAQDRNLNRQDYRRMEDRWASYLKDPSNKVFVNVESYDRDASGRPTAYMGYYIVEHEDANGKKTRTFETFSFLNESRAQIASFSDPAYEPTDDYADETTQLVGGVCVTKQSGSAGGASGKKNTQKTTAGEGTAMEKMNPKHYKNMIEALRKFNQDMGKTCEELMSASRSCVTILGEDDQASGKITAEALASAVTLKELGAEAQRIAMLMDDELTNAQTKMTGIWSDESTEGDD